MTGEQKEARKPILARRLKLKQQLEEVQSALSCNHCMDREWRERQVKSLSAKIDLINEELSLIGGA